MLGYNKNSAFLHLHVEMKSFHDALVALVQVLYSLLVALLVEQVAHQDLAVVALDLEKNRKIRKSSGKSSNKSLQKSNIEVMS